METETENTDPALPTDEPAQVPTQPGLSAGAKLAFVQGIQVEQGMQGMYGASADAPAPPPFGENEWKLLASGHFGLIAIDAMQIEGVGCLVRSAMTVVFVPNVKIKDVHDEVGDLIGRKLVSR